MAEALIEAIQDWTIKYVGSEITKTIHESMQEKFATMSSCLKNVVLFPKQFPVGFLDSDRVGCLCRSHWRRA